MKKNKILILILFIIINLGAIYVISKIFTLSLGILAFVFIGFFALVDLGRRIHNVRILKAQRKMQNSSKRIKMREHTAYDSKGKRK